MLEGGHATPKSGRAGLLFCIEEANICEILKTFDGDGKIIPKIIPRQASLWLLPPARLPKP